MPDFDPTDTGRANAEMAWDQRKDPDSTIRGYRINVIDTAREHKASSEDLLDALHTFEKRLRSLMRHDQR